MQRLNLPPYGASVKESGGKKYIFDRLRRRYVALTPEEWVRQHFVNYLVNSLGYPPGLMANEVEIRCGRKKLRADTVVSDRGLSPLMVVEYKAPDIPVNGRVLEQASAYGTLLGAEYMAVSNGMTSLCLSLRNRERRPAVLPGIPAYAELLRDAP